MSKYKLWYGVLEAGEKSSPVVIDRNMDTGDKNTVFMYNHNKQEILKYVRELAEPKLRELSDQEKLLESSLKKGFMAALETIKFKVPKALNIPEKKAPSSKDDPMPETAELEITGLDDDAEDDDWKDSDD
jgi:hypothetical protein